MLTFLRKIRSSLLDSGSKKYFLYAIGEIALVVIGILIALQINNWNEWRKERVLEKRVLVQVKKTLQQNINFLEVDRSTRAMQNSSSEIAIRALRERLPYHDSLNIHFQRARIPRTIVPFSTAGYEELKNAGFALIQTDSTRNQIIDLFEEVYSLLDKRIKYFGTFQPDRQHYVEKVFYYDNEGGILAIRPFNYESLLEDDYLLSMLISVNVQRQTIGGWCINALEESKKVMRAIDEELASD